MTHAPDLLSSLYVFLLATFVGLEVIKRVSPLLHTPLMSLTNAISAISIVGALIITGKAETPLSTMLGMARGHRLHDQRDRRLPHHLPHDQDVQEKGSGEVNETFIPVAYLAASAAFILALKWL